MIGESGIMVGIAVRVCASFALIYGISPFTKATTIYKVVLSNHLHQACSKPNFCVGVFIDFYKEFIIDWVERLIKSAYCVVL